MTDIYSALAAVMDDCKAVAKRDKNEHQRFMFRGIDAVVNAVGPILRKHRVIVVPDVETVTHDLVRTSNDKPATACRLTVRYTFYASDGSSITTRVAGEAWDHGDKATPKAMSVAFRTALLQALALPTDEHEPDAQTYERAAAPPREQAQPDPRDRKMRQMFAMLKQAGITEKQDSLDYVATVIGHDIGSRNELTLPELVQVIDALKQLLEADAPVAPKGDEA